MMLKPLWWAPSNALYAIPRQSSYLTSEKEDALSEMTSTEHMQTILATSSYCFASVGMLLFNKLAIQNFPLECCLVWAQLFFSAACLGVFGFPYIHVGSTRDLLRWCMVVPFYCGMLLTSILALKTAPMTLVIVLRNTSPLMTLVFERFYPEPLQISNEARPLGVLLCFSLPLIPN